MSTWIIADSLMKHHYLKRKKYITTLDYMHAKRV